VKVTDISKTENCFLARTIKRRLREVKIDKGVKVVFSSEIQDESSLKTTDGKNFKKSFYGTNSYMPGLFGLYAAETVIRYLLNRAIIK
jgi:tRNA A37 threonylcarbamoyladenosine dehydratase